MSSVSSVCSAIALVVDRSGSMEFIKDATKEGIKSFINSQKEESGRSFFTLAQFNHEYEVIKNFSDLQNVDAEGIASQFNPVGNTALYDAIGQVIVQMNLEISKRMDSTEKPDRVIIAIMTDGQDNESRDYTAEKIKALVEEKRREGWQFLFLSADPLTFKNSENLGFDSSSTIYFKPSNVTQCLLSASSLTSSARTGEALTVSEDLRNKLGGFKPFASSSSAEPNGSFRYLLNASDRGESSSTLASSQPNDKSSSSSARAESFALPTREFLSSVRRSRDPLSASSPLSQSSRPHSSEASNKSRKRSAESISSSLPEKKPKKE